MLGRHGRVCRNYRRIDVRKRVRSEFTTAEFGRNIRRMEIAIFSRRNPVLYRFLGISTRQVCPRLSYRFEIAIFSGIRDD